MKRQKCQKENHAVVSPHEPSVGVSENPSELTVRDVETRQMQTVRHQKGWTKPPERKKEGHPRRRSPQTAPSEDYFRGKSPESVRGHKPCNEKTVYLVLWVRAITSTLSDRTTSSSLLRSLQQSFVLNNRVERSRRNPVQDQKISFHTDTGRFTDCVCLTNIPNLLQRGRFRLLMSFRRGGTLRRRGTRSGPSEVRRRGEWGRRFCRY